MDRALPAGENPVISTILKYLCSLIFLVSAIGKVISFEETHSYFAGILKISPTSLTLLLMVLVIGELFISLIILRDGLRAKGMFILVQTILILFLISNILFAMQDIENCGCFGVLVKNSPSVGILKTVFLLFVVNYLRRGHRSLHAINLKKN